MRDRDRFYVFFTGVRSRRPEVDSCRETGAHVATIGRVRVDPARFPALAPR